MIDTPSYHLCHLPVLSLPAHLPKGTSKRSKVLMHIACVSPGANAAAASLLAARFLLRPQLGESGRPGFEVRINKLN